MPERMKQHVKNENKSFPDTSASLQTHGSILVFGFVNRSSFFEVVGQGGH